MISRFFQYHSSSSNCTGNVFHCLVLLQGRYWSSSQFFFLGGNNLHMLFDWLRNSVPDWLISPYAMAWFVCFYLDTVSIPPSYVDHNLDTLACCWLMWIGILGLDLGVWTYLDTVSIPSSYVDHNLDTLACCWLMWIRILGLGLGVWTYLDTVSIPPSYVDHNLDTVLTH